MWKKQHSHHTLTSTGASGTVGCHQPVAPTPPAGRARAPRAQAATMTDWTGGHPADCAWTPPAPPPHRVAGQAAENKATPE